MSLEEKNNMQINSAPEEVVLPYTINSGGMRREDAQRILNGIHGLSGETRDRLRLVANQT